MQANLTRHSIPDQIGITALSIRTLMPPGPNRVGSAEKLCVFLIYRGVSVENMAYPQGFIGLPKIQR